MANDNLSTQASSDSVTPPSPEEMLQRLNNIDVQQFNIEEIAANLKGNRVWISILTIPVSAIFLVSATLIGGFVYDSPIISFLLAAGILFWISKMFEGQERNYELAARQEVMNRIKQLEGEFGLIPHFKPFLPSKYRHLWQSLRKGNYIYIEQYAQATLLLQKQLDPQKFTRIWYINYPEIDPENPENQPEEEQA